MLGWLVNERAIEPHIPVFDKSARDDGTFSRGDFNYNQEADNVRASQAHPTPGPAQAERSVRCSRRVPPRCYSPEPQKAGKADPAARPNAGLRANKLTRA